MKGKSVETQVKGCGMDSDQRKAEKSGSEMLSFGLLQCKAETQEITSALISLFKCKHALLSSWQNVFLLLILFHCLFVGRYLKEQNSPLRQTDLYNQPVFRLSIFTNH